MSPSLNERVRETASALHQFQLCKHQVHPSYDINVSIHEHDTVEREVERTSKTSEEDSRESRRE